MDQISRAILTASGEAGGYQISRSLRFNSADSAYLARTFANTGNQKTWTWSGWLKLSAFGALSTFFERRSGASDATIMSLLIGDGSFGTTKDALVVARYSFYNLITTQLFRDPSAWYHIVLNVDTTQATSSNRMKLYVNGQQITAFSSSTYPSLNEDLPINAAAAHDIGKANYFNGYMTEINFIDGQALTPSSFGQTNAQTGVWEPVAYSGSYGTNGFYLNFSDNSNTTAATLGKDYSGNGNNWTPNNFSVTAGAGNDSLVDTPTPYGVDTGAGGSVRGNYCTWNPLARGTNGSGLTLSNGNLDGLTPSDAILSVLGTIGVSSGKWYWEITPTAAGAASMVGIGSPTANLNTYAGGSGGQSWGYFGNGLKYFSDVGSSYGISYGDGDVIGVALDMDAGTVVFYKNGVSQGTAFTGLTGIIHPMMGDGGTTAAVGWNSNFGQRPFAYTAPSGFRALCTQNLPTPTIGATAATQAGKYFNAVLYAGNGTNPRSITGFGFSPDFIVQSRRDLGYGFQYFDIVRGASKRLNSSSTAAEDTYNLVGSFDSDGFTITGSVDQGNNASGGSYVAWGWDAGGSGVTNTAGSITSTVSANTTSGFSIVTYTGTGANATVGHGLGAAPRMIIVKRRDSVEIWPVYHESIGNTQYLRLQGDNPAGTFNVWQNTSPTSSVFYISTDSTVNTNTGTYVAYCFAPIAGYSAFGSYTGNGSSDGAFVFTGFRPRYVMVKRTDAAFGWWIFDAARNPANAVDKYIAAESSAAENTFNVVDFTSNGFKFRDSSQGWNASGGTYIFAAFAEVPQKFALAR